MIIKNLSQLLHGCKLVENWLQGAEQTQFLAKEMQLIVKVYPSPLMPTYTIPQILRHSKWEVLT